MRVKAKILTKDVAIHWQWHEKLWQCLPTNVGCGDSAAILLGGTRNFGRDLFEIIFILRFLAARERLRNKSKAREASDGAIISAGFHLTPEWKTPTKFSFPTLQCFKRLADACAWAAHERDKLCIKIKFVTKRIPWCCLRSFAGGAENLDKSPENHFRICTPKKSYNPKGRKTENVWKSIFWKVWPRFSMPLGVIVFALSLLTRDNRLVWHANCIRVPCARGGEGLDTISIDTRVTFDDRRASPNPGTLYFATNRTL